MTGQIREPQVPCLVLEIVLYRAGLRPSPIASGVHVHGLEDEMERTKKRISDVYAQPINWLTLAPGAWPDIATLLDCYPRAAFRDPVTDDILYLFCRHSRVEFMQVSEIGKAPYEL